MVSYNQNTFVHLILFVWLYLGANSQSEWDVRLVNNTILEVYLDNKWGNICDDFWSLANTDVVCRSIGYRRGSSYSHGIVGDTVNFQLDNVICLGNESHIRECKHSKSEDCGDNEHLRIICEEDGCESYAPFADTESTLLKYYSDGNWYYLSSDGFTLENAYVVCNENTQTTVEKISYELREASDTIGIYPNRMNCKGGESSLCDCRKLSQTNNTEYIVKIKCKSSEGDLRLVSGVNRNSGFVLINHNETWKGICFDPSDLNFQTAYVACRQMGYKGLYNYYYDNTLTQLLNGGSYFTRTDKYFATWISRPNCTGDESKIAECSFNEWEDYICVYTPLWVICEPYVDHDVILVDGQQYDGVPQIFYKHQWHSICIQPNSYGVLDSICRSIGASSYSHEISRSSSASNYLYLNYTCFGNEKNLASCYSEEINPSLCPETTEHFLYCNPPLDETPSLAYGSSERGIIDLYVSNKWGISCINSTDEELDGQIICNQMGLNASGAYLEYLRNVFWEQKYWLSTYNCNGDEERLSDGNCLEAIDYVDQCSQLDNSPIKLFCRPSSNEMRLIPSRTNSSFFGVQFLSPEREWVSVCFAGPIINFCNTFGYNSVDVIQIVTDNTHIYTLLDCPNGATTIEQCTIKFIYDYINIYGCTTVLEIYCSNLEVPTFTITDLEGVTVSNNNVLLKWAYTYGISEEHMNLWYYLEITSDSGVATHIKIGTEDIEWKYDPSRVDTRYYIVRNLGFSAIYSFKLRLVNAAGYGIFGNSIQVRTGGQAPTGVPSNIITHSVGTAAFTIQWDPIPSNQINGMILGYIICIRISPNSDCEYEENFEDIQTTPYQLRMTGLLPYTRYSIAIRGYNSVGSGPYSQPIQVVTEPTKPQITTPSEDQLFTVTTVSEYESFSHTQACIATGVPTPTITWSSNVAITGDTTDHTITIDDLSADGYLEEYIFTCNAVNIAGENNRKITVRIAIELPAASTPTVKSVGLTYIDIMWSEYGHSDYVVSYEVCVKSSDEGACVLMFETPNTEYLIDNLQEDTPYIISIVVVTEFGSSPASEILTVKTKTTEPTKPQITTPSEDQLFTVTTVSEYESFSHTQSCIATGVPTPTITWSSNVAITEDTTDHTITIDDLSADGYLEEYIFTCNAVNIAGENNRKITVRIAIELPAASTPTVKSVGLTYIDIMWPEYGDSDYVVSYEVCVKSSDEGDCVLKFETKNTEYLIDNLQEDTSYRISIVVLTEFGSSPASEISTVETHNSVAPGINVPSEDMFVLIESAADLNSFSLTQACTATGAPQPTISWVSNTDLIFSENVLKIQAEDLSIDDQINPYIFTCIANNSAGRDSKEIRITINIDVDIIINEIVNVTDSDVSEITKLISVNNLGVNVSSENTTAVQDSIDNNAKDLENLINRFIENNTIDESKIEAIENLFRPASEIIRKDLELNSRRDDTNVAQPKKGRIITASRALRNTLDSVESLASNFVSNINTTDGKGQSVISSADITIVAESIVLSENVSVITIPDLANIQNVPITERIQIPNEVAMLLARNSSNLRIAATVVRNNKQKTIEQSNAPRLFSNIVSLVVPGSKGKIINLPRPIRLSMPVPPSNLQTQEQICSFLNQSLWSTDGLATNSTGKNLTFCYTNHLTSFAVFVTPRELEGSEDLKTIASIVSYVVLSISFICLIVSLILFLLSWKTFFKVEANIVYFNYALAMTLAYGLFLFGIQTGTIHKTVCMVVAFLLHYIWLAVFTWTLCNGILILYKLTLGILRDRKIYPFLIVFGWIFPIIIPSVTIAIKHDKYVNASEHCFLTYEGGLIWAFIGPILSILAINLIVLFIATLRIATTKFGTDKLDQKQALRKGLISALILTPLLGIPWLVLLLNIFIANPIVQWSFIIVNGLMGVFFFVAVTLRNAEVKKLFVKMTKDRSFTSTSGTDGKSSELFSKKFKRMVSKDSSDNPPFSPTQKGDYVPLKQFSIQETDLPNSPRPISGSFKYDDTPPKPKNFPKPRRHQKGSSSVDSIDEEDKPSHYDIPKNLKPINPPIYDFLRPASPEPNPVYDVIPEDLPRNYENVYEIGTKTIVSGKKTYQNLDEIAEQI